LLRIPQERRALQYNRREDVILYMETWAALLEEELLAQIALPTERLFKPLSTELSASENNHHALELAV
jgi:hypothetical protein